MFSYEIRLNNMVSRRKYNSDLKYELMGIAGAGSGVVRKGNTIEITSKEDILDKLKTAIRKFNNSNRIKRDKQDSVDVAL